MESRVDTAGDNQNAHVIISNYRHDRRADKRRYPHDRKMDIQMLKMFRNGYILKLINMIHWFQN